MGKTIIAVFENGVFKPLEKVDLPENKHVHLMVIPEEDARLLRTQKEELSSIVGIGESGSSNASQKHDQYIYGG